MASCPPRGPLRLRPGKASSAAPAGVEKDALPCLQQGGFARDRLLPGPAFLFFTSEKIK
ncbi:hypothetical protein [Polaromonas sp. CG9_12]|nr:hypothetical protein [Polaromonas sp. CG9_12]